MINSHYLFLIRYAEFQAKFLQLDRCLRNIRTREGDADDRESLVRDSCRIAIALGDSLDELESLGEEAASFLGSKGHSEDGLLENLLDCLEDVRRKASLATKYNAVVVKATSGIDSEEGLEPNPYADLVGSSEESIEPLQTEDEEADSGEEIEELDPEDADSSEGAEDGS